MNKLKIREGWTKTNELRNKKVGSGQTGKGLSLFFFFFHCSGSSLLHVGSL